MTSVINLLQNLQSTMLKYQRINNIENECITNTQFFYDTAIHTFSTSENNVVIKVIPTIVSLGDEGQHLSVHLMTIIGRDIFECSYDIFKHIHNEKFKYYYSIPELYELNINPELKREIIRTFLNANTNADRLNNDLCISNNIEYLNNLHNYVKIQMRDYL